MPRREQQARVHARAVRTVARAALAAAGAAALSAAGCNLGEPQPFDPRMIQQADRQRAAEVRPDYLRPLPTTRQSPFPLTQPADRRAAGNGAMAGGNGSSAYLGRAPASTLPTTGPAIGYDEGVVRMSLQEVVHRAVANNHDVRVAGYQPGIEGARIIEADANFDPVFFQNINASHNNTANAGQFFSPITAGPTGPISNSPIFYYTDVTDQYQSQTGVRQNLRPGGQVELQYEASYNHYIPNRFFLGPFYENNLTLKLTQPLLRNFGADVNQARIFINRDNQKVALLDFRKALETNAADIEKAYWQLVQAQRDVEIQADLLSQNESTFKILRDRMQRNLDVSILQVEQAQTSLEQRRVTLITAKQRVRDLSDQVKQLMSDPEFPVTSNVVILPADRPVVQPLQFSLEDEINTAMENRFELGEQQLRIDVATVTVGVAKNNLQPQLNFVGSTGVQGLESSVGQSFGKQSQFNHVSYSAGLQFEIPIGNRAARAIWKRVLLQRMQSIEQYAALVSKVSLDVKQASRAVSVSWDVIVASRSAHLAAEAALQAILDRERANEPLTPTFVQTKLDRIDALSVTLTNENQAIANYNIALAALEQSKGTLLRYNNVVMEEQAPQPADSGLLR